MNDRSIRILEFDKILKMLSGLTVSVLGKELVEALEPDKNSNKIQNNLKETSDGVSFIVRKGSPPMGGIHDIRDSIRKVDMGSILSPGELLKIADTLRASRNLKSYASDNLIIGDNNSVNELLGCLETHRKVEEKISNAILSEEEIADNASPTLNNIRRQIKDAQNSIKEKLNDMIKSQKYQKFMQEPIVTMRGDRYVVPVKQEYRSEIVGLVHDSSSSGATIFVEPMAVVEANNNIKQYRIKELIEIDRILSELTADVSEISIGLKSNVSILGKLDFIFAKAKLSLDYACVSPKINNNKRIIIKKGRHPLLDKKSVVPIDFWIGEGFKTLVVTGPNTGGKTVTLKTVGLFTIMAQAGLHVPANEGTELCIFNDVFADIGDEQSIEQSLSTFSSHMRNIVNILSEADDNSLTLFDELGAGTDPTEGAALAMAVLESLHGKGCTTIATTHYSELKVYAISTQGVENACCEFDIETLRPTYKLLIGVPGRSNAFAISKRLGLTDDIITRAKEFLSQEDIKFEDLLMNIEKNRSESEKDRLKSEVLRIEIENLKKEHVEQSNKLNANKEKILREAREEARRILNQSKSEANEILTQMRRLETEQETAKKFKEAEEFKNRLNSKLSDIEDSLAVKLMPRQGTSKPPKNLKPGDSVLIINLNQKGTVVKPPEKNGEAIILAGIMKINVHVSNLKLIDEQVASVQKSGSSKAGSIKSKSISTEIDLRGFSIDDAVEATDKYLDDASITGLHEVTIIHGKGTGVLRTGIHQFLKSNHHVESYRIGKYGEGESGVTVVELK